MTSTPIVFISHSSKDEELVKAIRQALQNAGVNPVFYEEFIKSSDLDIPCADEIANLIDRSCAVFILLGKKVGELPHTQGWIGYEVGVASIKSRREKEADFYHIGSVFLVEDVTQQYNAAIPYIDYVYLFDFGNKLHWKGVEVFAELKSYFSRTREEQSVKTVFTALGDEFRLKSFHCKFLCPYSNCRTKYELWIYKGEYRDAMMPPASIRCSVCRKQVNISITSDDGNLSFTEVK